MMFLATCWLVFFSSTLRVKYLPSVCRQTNSGLWYSSCSKHSTLVLLTDSAAFGGYCIHPLLLKPVICNHLSFALNSTSILNLFGKYLNESGSKGQAGSWLARQWKKKLTKAIATWQWKGELNVWLYRMHINLLLYKFDLNIDHTWAVSLVFQWDSPSQNHSKNK